eukprot:1399076-Alexandrium_andersonii.AAC.1
MASRARQVEAGRTRRATTRGSAAGAAPGMVGKILGARTPSPSATGTVAGPRRRVRRTPGRS